MAPTTNPTPRTNPIQADFDPKDDLWVRFNRHFCRFDGEVGDKVAFQRPKKHTVTWTVVHVENDPRKVHWKNKKTPQYIKLEGMIPDGQGRLTKQTVWTCENQIKLVKD